MLSAKKELFTPSGGGYQISRSVRLRSSASAYLNRTPTVASDRRTWTWSGWVKRGLLNTRMPLMGGYSGTTNGTKRTDITILDGAALNVGSDQMQTATDFVLQTTQLFRDPAAWYHIVVAMDTTQATSTNRVKIYVNGVQVTAFSTATYPSLNYQGGINFTNNQYINRWFDSSGGNYYGDGYMTEVNFIDGQALTPSSFGETNALTGVWQPKRYAGTYGTNGFYLNFSDNSGVTATTIGKDNSGNGNNWTPNNISITAGATYDSMLDVPTLWADGGNGRGNYAVLNPVAYGSVTNRTSTSNGNLSFSDATSTNTSVIGTIAPTSGKWYFELTSSNTGVYAVGLFDSITKTGSFYRNNGAYSSSFGGGGTTGYSSWTTGDVIGVAWDADAGKIWYAKNNTWQSGSPSAGTSPTNTFTANTGLTCSIETDNSAGTKSGDFNFGQRPFTYTPPTGFVALNTQNLPTPTISNGAAYMAATTYTGNGTTQSISNAVNGVSFQPDFVWFKNRTGANNHALYDSVRGRALGLISNATNAEQSASAGNDLVSFDSNGVSLGPVEDFTSVNGSVQSIVAWQWNAGGSTVTNTSGSITSQVRANATAGFSVVTGTFPSTGTSCTFGHGLGVAPSMIISKGRDGGTSNWIVRHTSLGNMTTKYLEMNNTGAVGTGPNAATAPSSTIASVSTDGLNNNMAFVAYCFAAVAGYSAFGSYTGNGVADGPFVYLGFRPRWLMVKASTASPAGGWIIYDTARDTINQATKDIRADLPNGEPVSSGPFDILSNGFKLRGADTNSNGGSNTYIYAAFAENPFKNSLAR